MSSVVISAVSGRTWSLADCLDIYFSPEELKGTMQFFPDFRLARFAGTPELLTTDASILSLSCASYKALQLAQNIISWRKRGNSSFYFKLEKMRVLFPCLPYLVHFMVFSVMRHLSCLGTRTPISLSAGGFCFLIHIEEGGGSRSWEYSPVDLTAFIFLPLSAAIDSQVPTNTIVNSAKRMYWTKYSSWCFAKLLVHTIFSVYWEVLWQGKVPTTCFHWQWVKLQLNPSLCHELHVHNLHKKRETFGCLTPHFDDILVSDQVEDGWLLGHPSLLQDGGKLRHSSW